MPHTGCQQRVITRAERKVHDGRRVHDARWTVWKPHGLVDKVLASVVILYVSYRITIPEKGLRQRATLPSVQWQSGLQIPQQGTPHTCDSPMDQQSKGA